MFAIVIDTIYEIKSWMIVGIHAFSNADRYFQFIEERRELILFAI